MNGMFNDCKSLVSLDLSKFNTTKVTDMSQMFNGCSSLVSLNISNFNTDKVTNNYQIFNNCNSLISSCCSKIKPITFFPFFSLRF